MHTTFSSFTVTILHWLLPLCCGFMLHCAALLACGEEAASPIQVAHTTDRLRVLIETDAGGDPDDEQSLVRFLLYTNEWDVEAIIANRPHARDGENRNPERTGLGVVQRLVKAYGECYPNLVLHDARYPSPDLLLERTVSGYENTKEGVNRIIAAADRADPRPLWYSDWGSDHGSAKINMTRALDDVLQQRSREEYARFKNRLRIVTYDVFGDHTTRIPPHFPLMVNTYQPELGGRRWYHRFSALTADAGGFDLDRDVLNGHGSLGAMYPSNTTLRQKEGDSLTFLYLVPTGMNDPEHPTWGSWAGRYGRNDDYAGLPYYCANQADAWRGATNRDNTLRRWAVDLQNDFRARLEWCVKKPSDANHPPLPILQQQEHGIVSMDVLPGATVSLDAGSSSDPDGDTLSYEWFVYPEAGTYEGDVVLTGGDQPQASVDIPRDAEGKTIHVIVAVRDAGSPPLARYRRAILNCRKN